MKFKMGSEEEYKKLTRKELQKIAKKNGIKANLKSSVIIDKLLAIKSEPEIEILEQEEKKVDDIDLVMSIVDNEIVKIDDRKFIKILFKFKNGPSGCQTFYRSTGSNSGLPGFWLPTNGISTISKQIGWETLWRPIIAKVPWTDTSIAEAERNKIGEIANLNNILYRTDKNNHIALITCILTEKFKTPDTKKSNCSQLLTKLKYIFNAENIPEIDMDDYRALTNWIGICNSYNWNPSHNVGEKITSAIENDGEYLSLWKDGEIPPQKPTIENVQKYVNVLNSIKQEDCEGCTNLEKVKKQSKYNSLIKQFFLANKIQSYKV